MKRSSLLLALVLSALSTTVTADPPDYSYVEVLAGHQSGDDLEGGGSITLAGSYSLSQYAFLDAQLDRNDFGDYTRGFGAPNIVQYDYQLGGGAHFPVAAGTDVVVRASYVSAHAGYSGHSGKTGTGAGLGAGVRSALTTALEAYAFYDRNSAGMDASSLRFSSGNIKPGAWQDVLSAGLRWHVTPAFTLGVGFESSNLNGEKRALAAAGWMF